MIGRGRGFSPALSRGPENRNGPAQNTRSQTGSLIQKFVYKKTGAVPKKVTSNKNKPTNKMPSDKQIPVNPSDENNLASGLTTAAEMQREIQRAEEGLRHIHESQSDKTNTSVERQSLPANIEDIINAQLDAKLDKITARFEQMLNNKFASLQPATALPQVQTASVPQNNANNIQHRPFDDSSYSFQLNPGRILPTTTPPNHNQPQNSNSIPGANSTNLENPNQSKNNPNPLPNKNINNPYQDTVPSSSTQPQNLLNQPQRQSHFPGQPQQPPHNNPYCSDAFGPGYPYPPNLAYYHLQSKVNLNNWSLKYDGSSNIERFLTSVNVLRTAHSVSWEYVGKHFNSLLTGRALHIHA